MSYVRPSIFVHGVDVDIWKLTWILKGVCKMKKRVLLSVMVMVAMIGLMALPAVSGPLPKPTSQNAEAQKLIDEAFELDRSGSSAEISKKCYQLMEKADKLDPNNPSILNDVARHYWMYGNHLPKVTDGDKEKLEDIYAKGLNAAEKSVKIKETTGGHYWLAVNKAAGLEFSSIFSQAAAFPSIYSHSEWVKNNDAQYYYGASGRLWSEILVRVPKAAVELVGWDVQEAVDTIDEGIKVEPRYFNNYLYKARFINTYFGNKDEALTMLDEMLKKDPGIFPEEKMDNEICQEDAKELWKEITGKDYPAK